MNAGNANLLNAVCLIAMSVWGFKATGSNTALIPMVFGAILLYFTNSIRNHNKVVAHIAVVLTLVILGALVGMRLPKSLDTGGAGLYRVIAMIATSTLALIMFIKSFIDAKKAKGNT